MAARRLAQVPMRALCSPVATRALNSAQDRTDAALHCTLVCCGLNLTTSTAAAQRSHSTRRKPACRSSGQDAPHGQPVRRAARFSATSASHSATARVVSTSNSKRAVISGVMSSTSV